MKFENDPFYTFPEIAVTNFYFQNPRWPPVSHFEFGSVKKRYICTTRDQGEPAYEI